jgi:hypothetical protein
MQTEFTKDRSIGGHEPLLATPSGSGNARAS